MKTPDFPVDMTLRRPPVVLVLGPQRDAISGVSTHLNMLFSSSLARLFHLEHFQVGSEGRNETAVGRLLRLLVSPVVLAGVLLGRRVNILHLNTSLNRRAYWRDLAYLLVARLCAVRVVYQVHGGDLPAEFCGRRRWLAILLRATLRLPAVVVVLASSELTAYRAFVPGQNIRLLANGIDHFPYTSLRRPLLDDVDGLQLLYIGRLARDKGLHEALHGLRLARLQGVAAQLTIAGAGPDETALRQTVRELNLEREVRFVGPVFAAAKLRLLAQADVLILPSYAEGLPYALLEGMAAGLPVVATPVGAIPDVVSEGEHGFFVPPRDIHAIAQAIRRLAADPAARRDMGARCRERIAGHYSIERLVDEYTRLYAELGGQRRDMVAPGA